MEIPTFAQKLRELRQRSHLTVRQLANELGVDPSLVSTIENAKQRPSERFIERVARYFSIDEDYLKFLMLDDPRIKRAVVESPSVPDYVVQEHPDQVRRGPVAQVDDVTHLIFETLFEKAADDPYDELFCAHICKKLRNRSPMNERLGAWIDLYEAVFLFARKDRETYRVRLEKLLRSPVLDYDPRFKAQLYAELSRKAYSEGEPEQALEYDLERKEIYTELNDERELAKALIDVGLRYESLGKTEDTIQYLNLALNARHIEKETQASTLLHIGILLRRIGELDRARDYLSKSRDVWRSVDSKRRVGETELAIGDSFLYQWDLKAARTWYNRSNRTLSALTEDNAPNFSVLYLLALVKCAKGYLELLAGRDSAARRILSEVYDEYRDADFHHVTKVLCLASHRLGRAYCSSGKYEEAEHYYREALEMVGDELKSRDRIRILISLCELYYRTQDQRKLAEEMENVRRDIEAENLDSNKECYPFLARFHCLEGRLCIDSNDVENGIEKYIQACLMALDWHPVLFEKEIGHLILEHVESADQVRDYAKLCDRLVQEERIRTEDPEFLSGLRTLIATKSH